MALATGARQDSLQKVASLLFDIELEDIDVSSFSHDTRLRNYRQQVERLLSPTSVGQEQLLRDVHAALDVVRSADGEVDTNMFAEVLSFRGYFAWLRTGKVEKKPTSAKVLRHTFVVVALPAENRADGQVMFIVDPTFKEKFKVSNTTPTYGFLWSCLPDVFVGTAEQLIPLVQLLSDEMRVSFLKRGSSFPPWREAAAMIPRWLPASADDVEVVSASDNLERLSFTSSRGTSCNEDDASDKVQDL